MTALAKSAPATLRTASGEPPLGPQGQSFRDDQGEMFHFDRARAPSVKIGVLELEGGRWMAHPPGFRLAYDDFEGREVALGIACDVMVEKARRYMAAKEGEGTHWTEEFGERVIAWANSLRPVKQDLVQSDTEQGALVCDQRGGGDAAASDAETVIAGAVSEQSARLNQPSTEGWQFGKDDAEQLTSDPVVNELVEAKRKRQRFPAKHIVSMTIEVVDGRAVNVGSCACGHVMKYIGGDYLRMDAAIEAHWRRFYYEPSVDGRGVPIKPGDAARIPSAKKPRKRKDKPSAPEGKPAPEPAPVLTSSPGAGEIEEAAPIGASSTEVSEPPGKLALSNAEADPVREAGLHGGSLAPLSDDDDLAIDWPSYDTFLEDKIVTAPIRGIEVNRDDLHPWLKPHCKDLVVWALRLGCAAIFANFGLHKTAMQLEWCRQLVKRTGSPSLSVLPLGVRHGFIKEALQLGMDVRFIRTTAELDELYCEGVRHFLTNYESVRDGKLDPNAFGAVSLDEASVLRSYGSKTFQEFLPLFSKVDYKLVATATPSPNRYKELIHYAGFLGVMDTGLALTRWFQRNSEKAGDLTLYPHKADEFWMWVHSWAAFLQKPSELGYSDEGYQLPPLKLRWHEVAADHSKAEPERDGQGVMFRDVASSLSEAAKSRRDSLPARIAKMSEIIAQNPAETFLIWHDLEAEREAIEDALPMVEYHHWGTFRDGNPHARALYDRHYSARPDRDSDLILGPGDKMILLTADKKALFGWRKFKDDSGQLGVNCAVFRNEGMIQSSDLIREAMAIAWLRWPGERFYTFVDAEEVASNNPGYCFLKAGWRRCGKTQGGLEIMEALPGSDVPEVTPETALMTITGSMDLDEREARLHDFEEGRTRYFATKPILSGSGSNFQYHCHRAIYVAMPGYGYKFNDFLQSLYRLQRFGQVREVEVDIVYAEDERAGRAALEEKWARDTEMRARMSEIIAAHGLNTLPLRDALLRTLGVKRVEVTGQNFRAINNDAVAECRTWPDDSVDEIITSIPFSNHYEYSASYRDFGHTDDNGHFWSQMDFLTTELLRMLKPGRLACIHVKDRVLFGNVTGEGVPTISPFHAEAIMHYRAHGFQYMGMIHVNTDVVRENNQTYRLGWSECCKDGTKMGVGSPEYVLLLRKRQSDRSRGYADVPVVKDKEDYSRARWQIDAHAMWRSSGNRLLTPEEFATFSAADLAKLFAKISVERVYDYEAHVRIGEEIDRTGSLPATFMAIAPGATREDTWHDIIRMRTLNMLQQRKGAEMHLCPLQFDIVDRLIERFSNEGELIFDPFGGLMTVPYRALLKKRKGAATELSAAYFLDGVKYLQMAEEQTATPQLFDLAAFDATNTPPLNEMTEAET